MAVVVVGAGVTQGAQAGGAEDTTPRRAHWQACGTPPADDEEDVSKAGTAPPRNTLVLPAAPSCMDNGWDRGGDKGWGCRGWGGWGWCAGVGLPLVLVVAAVGMTVHETFKLRKGEDTTATGEGWRPAPGAWSDTSPLPAWLQDPSAGKGVGWGPWGPAAVSWAAVPRLSRPLCNPSAHTKLEAVFRAPPASSCSSSSPTTPLPPGLSPPSESDSTQSRASVHSMGTWDRDQGLSQGPGAQVASNGAACARLLGPNLGVASRWSAGTPLAPKRASDAPPPPPSTLGQAIVSHPGKAISECCSAALSVGAGGASLPWWCMAAARGLASTWW